MTKHFNDENFNKDVIEVSKTKPVLVDFFAVWCGPCKMMAPIIDELSDDIGKKASIGKLNTEEAQATASKYNIMSIPALILFKDGEAKETIIGLQPKEKLKKIINKYIN